MASPDERTTSSLEAAKAAHRMLAEVDAMKRSAVLRRGEAILEANREGHSFTVIGETLGVTKAAIQKLVREAREVEAKEDPAAS